MTREQARAVDSTARALEIRAGAGTGKTTTLAHRVARLARDSRAPSRLVVVTFTRDATATLARRLSILMGRDHGVRVHSFHQWAARELPRESRVFLDEGDKRRLLRRALGAPSAGLSRALGAPSAGLSRALGAVDGDESNDAIGRVAGLISFVKNRESSVAEALDGSFAQLAPWRDALERAHQTYEEGKGARLDFDDLLVTFRDALARSSTFCREVQDGMDHLLVDEYQDVNRIQHDIVHLVASPKRQRVDVTVVGDTRQSIYAFRGGAPDHLERFLEPFGRRGKRLALTTSFRSTRALVDAGNRALSDAFPLRARPRAPRGEAPEIVACADVAHEGEAVLDRVESLLARDVDPSEIAVVARSRFLLDATHEELRDRIAADAWAAREPGALTAACDAYLGARPKPSLGEWVSPAEHARAARVLARRARAAGLDAQALGARRLLALPSAPRLDEVRFGTIHAAKGLEWDHVLLVGAREGGLPGEQALRAAGDVQRELIAEERRLFYVALTRARASFVATWAPDRRRTEASRFLAALAMDERAGTRLLEAAGATGA